MNMLRRAILAAALFAGLAPAFAQVPPPVPALPDTERRTSYSISGTTCACNVNFALYGDGTDYQNWVEVFLNGVLVNNTDLIFGWTITSPSGSLSNLARPITDAVLTFNSVQTGTVQIVGARRPRRAAQFNENRGVAARDFNQVLTDIIAQNREMWDKTNDFTGRAVLTPPGETMALLAVAANRKNLGACFDSSGNLATCVSVPSSTFTAGTGIVFTGTNPTTISALAALASSTSVESCGAVGNGIVDDAPAIRTCAAQVAAQAQGGSIGFSCNKTYLLASRDPLGNGIALLHPYSNVTYAGCGESSILKVAANMNTVSTQFAVIYPPDETATYTYKNTHYRNFKIDFNGANNNCGNTCYYQNVGIATRFGANLTIDNVTFTGNPGSQDVSIGNNSTIAVSDVSITNSRFYDACDIIASICTDHSSVYVVAQNYSITGNSFNFSSQSTKATAIEMHGINGTAQGNTIVNYAQTLNVAAVAGNTATPSTSNISFTGNSATSVAWGARLYFDGTGGATLNNIVINGNAYHQSIQPTTQPFFDFDQAITATGAKNVTLANNIFVSDVAAGGAGVVPAIALGRIANGVITNNTIQNGLGPCIGNGTFAATTSYNIEGNRLIDCGQTSTAGGRRGILINSGVSINSLTVSHNRIENTSTAYMTTGIDITLNLTFGYIAPNNRLENIAGAVSLTGTGFFPTTANGIALSIGQGLPITSTAALTDGQIIVGQTGAAPLPKTISGAGTLSAAGVLTLGSASNSLGANVSLNSTSTYFDGPSVAQGTSGTWFCSGAVTVSDSSAAAQFVAKLWDGTTVIASTVYNTAVSSGDGSLALSGYLASPAANIKISVKDTTSVNGAMLFNASGNSKDSTLSCFRIG